jgi:hypothetical protein
MVATISNTYIEIEIEKNNSCLITPITDTRHVPRKSFHTKHSLDLHENLESNSFETETLIQQARDRNI